MPIYCLQRLVFYTSNRKARIIRRYIYVGFSPKWNLVFWLHCATIASTSPELGALTIVYCGKYAEAKLIGSFIFHSVVKKIPAI